MQPYKRKRRTRRDMITLGGWLFADLLLGLSLLFLVANTVGEGPPEPTPTPMPDYLATAESEIASNQLENRQTVVALEGDVVDSRRSASQAQSTADALATQDAMSASERATADANATNDAIAAQATIDVLATEQAANAASQDELNASHATTVAEATNVAQQLEAQGTEQAGLRAAATQNSLTNAETQSTIEAMEANNANSQATIDSLEQSQGQAVATSDSAVATTDAANNEVLAAQEQAQLNTLDPNAVPETITVDLDGVRAGDEDALEQARGELHRVLDPYANSETCRIGFVLLSSRAPTIGEGIELSDAMAAMIESEFPGLLPRTVDGTEPTLASESIALPNTTPTGEVQLLLFLSAGCEPASGLDAPMAIYIREAR